MPDAQTPQRQAIEDQIAKRLANLSPEERNEMLLSLATQQQRNQADDNSQTKIEDALLLLRLRPKIRVTTFYPRTGRSADTLQDRKVWDQGVIDPLANEDQPDRPQIVKVVTVPDDEILFERDEVMADRKSV